MSEDQKFTVVNTVTKATTTLEMNDPELEMLADVPFYAPLFSKATKEAIVFFFSFSLFILIHLPYFCFGYDLELSASASDRFSSCQRVVGDRPAICKVSNSEYLFLRRQLHLIL